MPIEEQELIIKTVRLAGTLLMESGAETSRVEGTMEHMLKKSLQSSTEQDFDVFVLLNVIYVRLGTFQTSFQQVPSRSNHLGKISSINQLSRDYCQGYISLRDTYQALLRIKQETYNPYTLLNLLAVSVLSGSVVFLYGGTFIDFLPALGAGLASYMAYHIVGRWLNIPFVGEFLATFCGGVIGYFLAILAGTNFAMVTIGAVIPHVPGVAVTNATRDIMNRHYLTGMIRWLECLCIAIALGGGLALAYYILP